MENSTFIFFLVASLLINSLIMEIVEILFDLKDASPFLQKYRNIEYKAGNQENVF